MLDPWSEGELRELMRDRGTVGKAATIDRALVGYLVYCLSPLYVEIAAVGVLPDCRGCGIGTAMMAQLLSRLTARRSLAICDVDANALNAQRFLGKVGFVASEVVRSRGAEWYRFTFRRGWPLPGEE